MPKRKRLPRAASGVRPPHTEQAPTRVVIDAVEGNKARVELPDGTTADWDRASLPAEAQEGDVIRIEGEGEHQTFMVDTTETETRRQQAQAALDALNAGSTTGDLDL